LITRKSRDVKAKTRMDAINQLRLELRKEGKVAVNPNGHRKEDGEWTVSFYERDNKYAKIALDHRDKNDSHPPLKKGETYHIRRIVEQDYATASLYDGWTEHGKKKRAIQTEIIKLEKQKDSYLHKYERKRWAFLKKLYDFKETESGGEVEE